MIKFLHYSLIAGIACLMMSAKLYSQDTQLPESWVNPPPDVVPTYQFEPSPLKPLVSMGTDGKLVYKPYSDKGDRVLDWSKVGYEQSNVPIPHVLVKDTLSPLEGETSPDGNMAYPKGPDSHDMIQTALYKVWQMTPDANGNKGAVLLKAGTYYINGSIVIPSGVVLRGEGDDENGTILIFRSTNGGGSAIKIGQGSIQKNWASTVRITDEYVPSGSYEISVTDASGFKAGDFVFVRKTVNQAWIDTLGMGERLRHIRGGEEGLNKVPWEPENYQFMHLRQITRVEGNTITLDVMMPQSISDIFGGGEVLKADVSSLSTQCGVESLSVVSNYDATAVDTGKDATDFINYQNGISVSNAMDCWLRDVTVKHVYFAAVGLDYGSRQVTVRDCKSLEPIGPYHGGFRYPFCIGDGTGHLMYNCYSEDGRHDFVGGSRAMGPYAFVKCTAVRGEQSEPHHRWGTGFLYDEVTTKDGSIAAINSGDSGTGHGWAAANTLIWNGDASAITVFDPETEGENNFAIGYTGDQKDGFDPGGIMYANTRAGYWGTPYEGKFYGFALMGSGYIESPTAPVEPRSLFIQQLIDRIGLNQAMRVLDDDQELEPRLGIVDLFSAYPELEKVNDSTFIIKFNMPVNSIRISPENFIVGGDAGFEGADFTTTVLKDSTVRLRFEGVGPLQSFTELKVEASNVTSLTGQALEGISTATYAMPDLRPVVTGMAASVNNEDGFLEASSSKPGSIYLVEFVQSQNYLDYYKTVDDLDQFVDENRGRKVDVPYADSTVLISTKGLPGAFYIYFAVDEDGRMSEPGNEWPEVVQTGPLLGLKDVFMNPEFSLWSSDGTIYIKPNDPSLGYSVQIFDMMGRLFKVRENMMGDQQLMGPGYRGILIIRLITGNGRSVETCKLPYNPSGY